MIVRLETCASTMAEAAKLVREGCPSLSAVVTEEQTAGYGRHGRAWHSERGAGLYVSLVLRLALPIERLPVLSLALGLATAEAIARTADIACDLRWPNDVLIGERKVAGILVETEGTAFIAGIGVNVNHSAFPSDLAAIATSLRIATGREQSKETLLTHLLASAASFTKMLTDGGPAPVIAQFTRASSYARGKRVIVEGEEGITDGLDPAGFLFLRRTNGQRTLILAGGIRPIL